MPYGFASGRLDILVYDAAPICGWYDKREFWRRSLRSPLRTLLDMLFLRGTP